MEVKMVECPTCKGAGDITTLGGITTCPTCGGKGKVPAEEAD